MNSKDYWAKREAEALKHYITDEAEYDRQIEQIYQEMLDSCQTQINDFYGRYAAKEGITLAEAKKRVSKLDIEKYERKAKRYVKDKDFSDKANEEMRLYNATMKINRLEMLKANIGLELIAGHDELEKFMGDILKGRTEEELKRQAGILGKTIRNNAQLAHAIPNASFHNATFSDRIWQYQDLMREDLSKILSRGLIQGKNPRAIAKDLRKYWYGADPKTSGGAVYCMERLMRTELARVQTEAQKQSFEKNGFEKYIFIVNGGCCLDCEAAKNKDIGYGKGVYLVKDMMPGENASPMHPHCRCSTAAYEDSKEYEEWLDFLANGGTTEEYNKQKADGLTNITKSSTIPKVKFESFKLSGIDKDYISDITDTFNGLMNDYPVSGLNVKTNNASREFGHYVGGIKGVKKDGKQYAVFDNEVCISKMLQKNKATSTEEHIYNYGERGSALKNAKRVDLATIPHEYGHAIDSAYAIAKDPTLKAFAEKYKTAQKVSIEDIDKINSFNMKLNKSDKRLSKEIFDELQKEYNLDYMGTVMRIDAEYGSYASSSVAEFLAEGFANMRMLPESEKTDFMKSFEKIFNRKFNEVLGG